MHIQMYVPYLVYLAMQQHKKLIVGTTKGMIKIFDSSQGELVSEF